MARRDSIHSSLLESHAFQYILALSIIATLAISIVALTNVYQIKKIIVPRIINSDDFLKKLSSHVEMKSYLGVAPLNVVQISNSNFLNLQFQISQLDESYIGNFLVQYSDKIVIYDYGNDKIRANININLQKQQQPQLPGDFFTRLNKHPETNGLQNQQPIGGQLDAASLGTLKQQFPDVYKDAKVGDFLLRYQTKLIIYDYNADRIVNAANLS